MAYDKKLYKSDDSVIDSSVIYDDTQEKLQSEINAAVNSAIASLDSSISHAVKNNVQSQTINSSAAITQLAVSNNGTSTAYIRADTEGGNLRLGKTSVNYAEIDSSYMDASGTGYARMYVTNGASESSIKIFQFNQDGSFTDGNGVNTATLNSNKVSKSGDTMTGSLSIASSNIDTEVIPQSGVTGQAVMFRDKNNKAISSFYPGRTTSGANSFVCASYQLVNGTNKTNYLLLGTTLDGDALVQFSHPAAWRSALKTITHKEIAGSDTTSAANDYKSAIKNILTSNAPQSWDAGVYSGSFRKTNSGTQTAWNGMYILNVYTPNTNWSSQGIAATAGHLFNIWYKNGEWSVTQMAEAT